MLEISCIILFEYISSLYSCSPLDAVVEIADERPVPDHMEMLLFQFCCRSSIAGRHSASGASPPWPTSLIVSLACFSEHTRAHNKGQHGVYAC